MAINSDNAVDDQKKSRLESTLLMFSRIFIVTYALVFLISGNLFADELVIYGDDSGPPKYFLEHGKPKGFIVDIAKWVLDDIQQEYKIELLPWARAYKYSLEGMGGIIGLSMSSERTTFFDYSDPLYFADKMIVVKKGNEFPFQTIQDLKGKTVAVVRGSSYGDAYSKAVKDKVFTVYDISTIRQALQMLVIGRVDAGLIGPGRQGLITNVNMIQGLEIDQFSILPVPLIRDGKHLGFPKSLAKKELLKRFNSSLKRGWESGELKKIVDNYYHSY